MNKLKLIFVIAVVACFESLNAVSFAQNDSVLFYKITRIVPEAGRIRVGDRLCVKGDTIVDTATIFLGEGEGLIVERLGNSSIVYKISETVFRNKAKRNIRFLYSKGDNDLYVLFENDSIVINHEIDTAYQYRMKINGGEKQNVCVNPGMLVLHWDLFKDYSGQLIVYLDRKRKNSRVGIEKVGEFGIDIINTKTK